MQIKTFSIPVFGNATLEEEVNRFLRGHRILQVERHFCADNGGYWAIFIEYADYAPDSAPASRKDKADATKDLNEEEKQRFDYFRKVRREIAMQKSIPAYMVFTDAELAILAKIPELRADTAKDIKGIATSRLNEYVSHFYVVKDGEESGQPAAPNSGN